MNLRAEGAAMGREQYVGRVGALAVALGIGCALAAMPGQAWAQPDTSRSIDAKNNSSSRADSRTSDSTARSSARSKSTAEKENNASTADPADSTELPTQRRSAKRTVAKELRDAQQSVTPDRGPEQRSQQESFVRNETDPAPESTPPRDDDATPASTTPAEVAPTVSEPATAVIELGAPAHNEPETAAPATETTATSGPGSTLATVVQSLFSPTLATQADNSPESPAASPLLWTLAAYARRELGEHTIHDRRAAASTSQVAAMQAVVASTTVPGDATASPIVAGDGTVYQVSDSIYSRVTSVTILDSSGQVTAASPEIRGTLARAVARPDGSLVVMTLGTLTTTVSVVNSEGKVTRVGTVLGQVYTPVTVGSDGALYFRTSVTNIFNPIGGAVGYRTHQITARNFVRTFSHNTDYAVGSDGTAYLVSSNYGFSNLRVIPSGGFARLTPLPFGVDPSAPIVGEDGTGYVTVGVRPFGVQQTRLYTATRAATTVRTITGLPGGVVIGTDGVYLETFTYPGSADVGTGTTYISRITATSLNTSDAIDGRIGQFQVTRDGTTYAPLRGITVNSTPVAVVDSDGTVRTLDLPGTVVEAQRTIRDGGSQNAEDLGYLTYRAPGGQEYVAVLNPDGTVQQTIELPEGATGGSVFFSPDGAPFQMIEHRNAQGQIIGRQILALSTTTYTDVVPGSKFTGVVHDIVFGPDGTGHLLTGSATGLPGNPVNLDVLAFNAAGETVARASGLTNPATTYENNPERQILTFDRNGVAYVVLYRHTDEPGVYAITATGAQKVADLDYVSGQSAFPAVFGIDGTGYVTTSRLFSYNPNATATITTFPPLGAL
ncbi:hypothetical protein [Mycobacterium sp. SMC-4]|uniref:hypothetical protein n=1 Tax=Mycobacterium sp. SMC-4 TaxID=2857059 RepID=UPI0021B24C71|nr:hypothetical protein [Mycobacterium sp. SMC-4]UXA17006.1 hypothetical protein KXD98_19930 [Mycobacterium sp. SMC-4]